MNKYNKKALIVISAAMMMAAPMAMAQDANSPPKTEAAAATQVDTAHDQAKAQQAQTAVDAGTQEAPPTTAQNAPPAKASGEKTWTELDGNNNGTLSNTEAQAMPTLAKIFTDADANADGELTQDEYKAWVASNTNNNDAADGKKDPSKEG